MAGSPSARFPSRFDQAVPPPADGRIIQDNVSGGWAGTGVSPAGESNGRAGGPPIAGRSENLAATWRFISDLWSRALDSARIVFEELDRSRAASRRYDELRTGRGTNLALRGRKSNARQVFVEIYAGTDGKVHRLTRR